MAKQKKKPAKKGQTGGKKDSSWYWIFEPRENDLILLMNLVPTILLGASLVMLASHYFEFRVGDIMITYLPQYIILLAGAFLLEFYLVARFIIRNDLKSFKKAVDPIDRAAIIALFVCTAWLLHLSNFVTHIPLQEDVIVEDKSRELTLVTHNALINSTDIETNIHYIESSHSDILALQEIRPEEAKKIKDRLHLTYDYITDCDCSAGDTEVALLSRHPITFAETVLEVGRDGAIIRAEILAETTPLVVYALHIPPPTNDKWYSDRNESLAKLSDMIAEEKQPVFVLGDFNTSVYSPVLRAFSSSVESDVLNTTQGGWPQCSWFGRSEAFCARIDHIFAPPEYTLIETNVSAIVNSDHKVVTAKVLLP